MPARQFLGPALVATWVVGMGRYWDHPSAHVVQMLGVGSLLYVFVLSSLLWAVIAPLRPERWSYGHALLFVSLTSPPAILYAIPVERWTDVQAATLMNTWFLGIVALWRVCLLVFVLRRFAGLSWPRTLIGSLLPLVGIVVTLTVLNLENAVFEIMAGLNRPAPTSHDGAYLVVVVLSVISIYAFVPLLLTYLILVRKAFMERRRVAGV